MDKGHKKKFTLELPKEEELIALKIRPSKLYHPISKIKIYFDDDPKPVIADIPVRKNPIVEDIPIHTIHMNHNFQNVYNSFFSFYNTLIYRSILYNLIQSTTIA